MDNTILVMRDNETTDGYLYRLGSLKEAGVIQYTWPQLAMILNTQIPDLAKPLDESTWRKRYQQLASEQAMFTSGNNVEDIADPGEFADNGNLTVDADKIMFQSSEPNEEFDANKMIWRLRDERYAINRITRSQARGDALYDLFKTEIARYSRNDPPVFTFDNSESDMAVYALLSDIHYGIAFTSSAGSYNSDIARERVMHYASEIISIGAKAKAKDCYVSLLGDMISGIIHAPIRIENRENAVQQVIGVSELVADFLFVLSSAFAHVYVNSVSGNHSRLDMIAENSLRAEKLDSLIPWYCKAKLENIDNVIFEDNEIDPTVCSFHIFGVNYIGVHGDMDKDLQKSAANIEKLAGYPVDYMIAGHLHVPNIFLQDRGYIRNGSVCGSGDDYTMRNRLFSDPKQICMTVTEDGVKSIWPIKL